eukprot:COSAG01_NODE_36678_length_513_cov_291.695652_2_plen_31_part_01
MMMGVRALTAGGSGARRCERFLRGASRRRGR